MSSQREKLDFGLDQTMESVAGQREKTVLEIVQREKTVLELVQREMPVFGQTLIDQKLIVNFH